MEGRIIMIKINRLPVVKEYRLIGGREIIGVCITRLVRGDSRNKFIYVKIGNNAGWGTVTPFN
jgi:hypothetical protein